MYEMIQSAIPFLKTHKQLFMSANNEPTNQPTMVDVGGFVEMKRFDDRGMRIRMGIVIA
jgi:hypothetical protein